MLAAPQWSIVISCAYTGEDLAATDVQQASARTQWQLVLGTPAGAGGLTGELQRLGGMWGGEGCRSGRERWEEQLCWRHEPGEGDAWLHELGCQLRCMGLHAPGKVSPFAVGPPRLHAGACVQARVLHRCACQQVITACTPVQVLLYGLPLTALVGVAALALWNLSGPPVRPGSSVPGSPFAAKAHTSPLHFGRR